MICSSFSSFNDCIAKQTLKTRNGIRVKDELLSLQGEDCSECKRQTDLQVQQVVVPEQSRVFLLQGKELCAA